MNFLITGATGFIGRRLIARLHRSGHFVSVFTRHVEHRDDRNVGQYYWDMNSPAPAEPFQNVDVVIHLAGEPIAQRWNYHVKHKIRESRVLGTRHLVEGMGRLKKPPPVLISASAIGYYGDRADELLTEESIAGTGFLPEVCAAWEHESERARPLGVRVVHIRTGIVLGPEGGALKQMLLPFKFGVGGRLGDGLQWMSWIHIDDLVDLYLFTAENAIAGPVNGVAPLAARNDVFTRLLGETLHRPAIFPVPVIALKLLYGEMSQVLLESQRVKPRVALDAGFQFRHPDLPETLQNLLNHS
jgi:uncharacterized protein (TIGR01777 family)